MNVMNTYSIRVMTKRWGRVALGNKKLGRAARAHSSAEASEPEAFASPQVRYCGVFVGSVVARRAASCPFQPPVPRAFRRMDGTTLLWFVTLPPALFYLSVSRFRATAKRTRTTTVFKCHRVCATDSAERHDGHHFPLLLIPHIFFWSIGRNSIDSEWVSVMLSTSKHAHHVTLIQGGGSPDVPTSV